MDSIAVRPETEVGQVKQKRKLPTTPEERVEAYHLAMQDLSALFKASGCQILNEGDLALTIFKRSLTMDIKVMENKNIVGVTSGLHYDPTKAGTKESGATITKGRDLLKSRHLLRVTVSGIQSLPTFFELRQNIEDPELHICKAVMFVLQLAIDRNSALYKELSSTKCLQDVPSEWLDQSKLVCDFPELHDFIPPVEKPAAISLEPA